MQRGAVFRIIRHGDEYAAERISAVAIFPCEGMRDDASEAALNAAFETGRVREVRRLYRRGDVPGGGFWGRGAGGGPALPLPVLGLIFIFEKSGPLFPP